MTTCAKCHGALEPQHKFCIHCGAPQSARSTPTTSPVVTRGPNRAVPPAPSPSPNNGDRSAAVVAADPAMEASVRRWIEMMIGEPLAQGGLCSVLKSGIHLCKLVNRIRPDMIRKVNLVSQPFLEFENVNQFVWAARALGLQKNDVIQATDLVENPRPDRLVSCLVALAAITDVIAPTLPKLSKASGSPAPSVATTKEANAQQLPPSSTPLTVVVDETLSLPAESPSRRRTPSIALQRTVDELREQQAALAREQEARIAVQQQMSEAERQRQAALAEINHLRERLRRVELENQILEKKAAADRAEAVEQQQAAVLSATAAIESRLIEEHQAELALLSARAEQAQAERERRMRDESRAITQQRQPSLLIAQQRIVELERSQSTSTEEIERIREECRVQIAVETERVRLEADQRALEQVRLQTEQAQRDMSAQVELQCAAELRKVQAAFDAEMQERAAALTAESEAREAAMRARLAEELERAKSLGNALEEERCARERFERERDALRRDIDMQRQAVASEQGVLQADREARLRKEFDDELQRMKSVLEQRVRSEEARRVEERREMEERHRAEERKLVAANAQLVEAEAKLRASSAEERAALEQAVANLKAAVKQSEGAARVRAAVEAERDRFQTRIAELEAERAKADAAYEQQLQASRAEAEANRKALERMRVEVLEGKNSLREYQAQLADVQRDQAQRNDDRIVELEDAVRASAALANHLRAELADCNERLGAEQKRAQALLDDVTHLRGATAAPAQELSHLQAQLAEERAARAKADDEVRRLTKAIGTATNAVEGERAQCAVPAPPAPLAPPAAGVPPPPPPPPPAGAPPPPPPPAAAGGAGGLAAALKDRPALRKAPDSSASSSSSAGSNANSDLMAAIRAGAKLKSAANRVLPPPKASPVTAKPSGGGRDMMGMMNIAQIAAQKAAARKKRVELGDTQ